MAALSCPRPYRGAGTTGDADFAAVRAFLLGLNSRDPVCSPEFLWARWEWAFCLPYLDRGHLDRIGVWEADGRVVALATHESALGEAYLAVDPAHRAELLPDLVAHAERALAAEGTMAIPVGEDEPDLAALLATRGYEAMRWTEDMSVRTLEGVPAPRLPEGYRLSSLAEGVDLHRLNRCLHRGFGHPDPVPEDEETLRWRKESVSAPSLVPELNTIVVAPDGEYAAYCGIFLEPSAGLLMVEPVCTEPGHRRRGLARAAVQESLRRAAARGAHTAYVGSDLPLYRDLGFAAFHRSHWWRGRVG